MPTKTMDCRSFPYVATPAARVLILGSMPGRKSLEAGQYYAHPQNLFWDIMEGLISAGRSVNYPERLRHLRRSRIALWDVAFQCQRNGSLDADIETETVVPNDFKTFFKQHPKIHTVFFNGHKAEQLFRKLVLHNVGEVAPNVQFVHLPSTSPAHASLSKKEKRARWYKAIKAIKLEGNFF